MEVEENVQKELNNMWWKNTTDKFPLKLNLLLHSILFISTDTVLDLNNFLIDV